jgi:predicted amino acid racemase
MEPSGLLARVVQRNPQLVAAAVALHQEGRIPPNTWLFDLDAVAHNARLEADGAAALGLRTYFMTKQHSRNPMVTWVALDQGLGKAVAVDMQCAYALSRYRIPVGHIGHLNQIPRHAMPRALDLDPEVVTLYSEEAAASVSVVAGARGSTQDVLLRVHAPGDEFFAGQEGGFPLDTVVESARRIAELPNVRVAGVTSFPCVHYDFDDGGSPRLTPNLRTLLRAAERLERELGLRGGQINAPGNTSVITMRMLRDAGATHVEPGHGVLGSTPAHIALGTLPEMPAYVYVSEVSHHHGSAAYAFGGGFYTVNNRSGNGATELTALVGRDADATLQNAVPCARIDQIIDYHAPLLDGARCRVGDTVVMAFRTQTHMTRSYTAAVSGVARGAPALEGLFDHASTLLDARCDPVAPAEAQAQVDHVRDAYRTRGPEPVTHEPH